MGQLATCIEQEIRRLCEARHGTIAALSIQPDQVPLFLSAPPSVALSEIAHQGKGATARKVLLKHVLKNIDKYSQLSTFIPSFSFSLKFDSSSETTQIDLAQFVR